MRTNFLMKKAAVEDALRCSFCRKRQETVGKLISSPSDYPRAYICDECIAICAAIIQDDLAEAGKSESAREHEAVVRPARVFILEHVGTINGGDEEDVKLIGIYSTRARAEEAVVRLRSLPGFREAPKGFSIDEYPLDHDHWTSGYVSVGRDPE